MCWAPTMCWGYNWEQQQSSESSRKAGVDAVA